MVFHFVNYCNQCLQLIPKISTNIAEFLNQHLVKLQSIVYLHPAGDPLVVTGIEIDPVVGGRFGNALAVGGVP